MTDRVGYLQDIEELKNEWIENLLLFLGIDIQILNNSDRQSFVHYLFKSKIEIIENLNDGSLQVRQENEIVGTWEAPQLILKKDLEDGSLYYEITLEYWSVSEENITN